MWLRSVSERAPEVCDSPKHARRTCRCGLACDHRCAGRRAADRADVLTPEQQRLLEAIADQLALALERERMAEAAHAATLRLSAPRCAIPCWHPFRTTCGPAVSHRRGRQHRGPE